MRLIAGSGPLAILDAAHALGPAAATKAVDRGIELAREHGIGLVGVRNGTHFGTSGFYARRAAAADLIGIAFANAPKRMAPFGTTEAFLGTNAIAISLPIRSGPDFCLDMSQSLIPGGKVTHATALGYELEPGVALDPNGDPTVDPFLANIGALLPTGGAKGSGLAFALGLLTTVLTGADFDDQIASLYAFDGSRQNSGYLFVVIDPWRLGERDSTLARIEAAIERFHKLRLADGSDPATYPGERSSLVAATRGANGVPFELRELLEVPIVCRECGLEALAQRIEDTIGTLTVVGE